MQQTVLGRHGFAQPRGCVGIVFKQPPVTGGILDEVKSPEDRQTWKLGAQELGGRPGKAEFDQSWHVLHERVRRAIEDPDKSLAQLGQKLVLVGIENHRVQRQVRFPPNQMIGEPTGKLGPLDEASVERRRNPGWLDDQAPHIVRSTLRIPCCFKDSRYGLRSSAKRPNESQHTLPMPWANRRSADGKRQATYA